jgi:glycosyltransferase involved in cell wall biosynthesis
LNVSKRILHLIHSGGFYGAEAVILNLSLGLAEAGIKPVVCCFWTYGQKKPEIGIICEKKGLTVKYIHFKRKAALIKPSRQLVDIMREQNINIIHSHGYKPSFYCLLVYLLFRTPYIVTCHLWFVGNKRMKFYILLEKVSMLFAKKIIAVSHPIAKEISSWLFLRRKVKVINNGIDISKYANYDSAFNEKQLRKELGLQDKSRLVGSLGRLTSQKAYHTLVKAANSLLKTKDNLEFIVAGEGPQLHSLKELTKQYGINDKFHFIGFRSDAIHILRLLDIFVLCSIDEGLPIVLLEAMSVGVPVITTNVGEIPFVVQEDYNGLLINKNDTKSLAENIEKLLFDKNLSEKLVSNAKKTVSSQFSISNMCNKYMAIYDSLA